MIGVQPVSKTSHIRSTWWRVLCTFAPELLKHRRMLLGSYLSGFLAVGAMVLAPWPLKFLIDHVLGQATPPAFFSGLAQGLSPTGLIVLLACAIALISAFGTVFSALEKIINARVRERMGMELRDRLLRHLQTLSLTLRTERRSGELVLRLVDDVNILVRLLSKTTPVMFRHLANLLLTFSVMFWLDFRLGLLGVGIVAGLLWLVRRYAHPLWQATREKRRSEGDVAGLAQEIIRGLQNAQASGTEEKIRERFMETNARTFHAGVRRTQAAVRMERAMQVANGIAVALIAGVGGLLVFRGALTVGGLTVFVAYITQLLKPVEKVNELASSLARGLARGEQLLALLDQSPDIRDLPEAIEIGRSRGMIELRSVSFSYPPVNSGEAAVPVLRDVSFCLKPGSLNVLVGRSGSGKSTLLGLLLRLYDPAAGEILLDGIPYSNIRLRHLRMQHSVMLQDTHLFAGTVREALTLVEDGPDARLWDVLAFVALEDFVRALPGGLDAFLGEEGVNLSGGQRARLSLARALLPDRPILLLDEPFANVDRESQGIMLDALERVRGGRTCLVVTHQSSLAERADVILQLKDRQIKQLSSFRAEARLAHGAGGA